MVLQTAGMPAECARLIALSCNACSLKQDQGEGDDIDLKQTQGKAQVLSTLLSGAASKDKSKSKRKTGSSAEEYELDWCMINANTILVVGVLHFPLIEWLFVMHMRATNRSKTLSHPVFFAPNSTTPPSTSRLIRREKAEITMKTLAAITKLQVHTHTYSLEKYCNADH